MNIMALIALLALAFVFVTWNLWIPAGVVLVFAVVYLFSSNENLQKKRSEYQATPPAHYNGPGAEEKVGTSVGKAVNVVGSMVGGILGMLFRGPNQPAGDKKDDSGPGRGPNGARKVKITQESEY